MVDLPGAVLFLPLLAQDSDCILRIDYPLWSDWYLQYSVISVQPLAWSPTYPRPTFANQQKKPVSQSQPVSTSITPLAAWRRLPNPLASASPTPASRWLWLFLENRFRVRPKCRKTTQYRRVGLTPPVAHRTIAR